jgi:hypothetical protein
MVAAGAGAAAGAAIVDNVVEFSCAKGGSVTHCSKFASRQLVTGILCVG